MYEQDGSRSTIQVEGDVSIHKYSTAPLLALVLTMVAMASMPGPTEAVTSPSNMVSSRSTNISQRSSIRWSGYATLGSRGYVLNYVGSELTIPQMRCGSRENSVAAFWIGLGGASKLASLPQAGFDAACIRGKPSYWAWDEWWDPKRNNPSIRLPQIRIFPGDIITINVSRTNQLHYLVTMLEGNPHNGDQTGWAESTLTDQNGDAVGNSAECIVETPQLGKRGGLADLTHFGEFSFNSCEATQTSPSSTVVDVNTGEKYVYEDDDTEIRPAHVTFEVWRLTMARHEESGRTKRLAVPGLPRIPNPAYPITSVQVYWLASS